MARVLGRTISQGTSPGDSALLVLGGIDLLTRKYGYPPTAREIGEAVGLQYTSVQHHIKYLWDQGLVAKERYMPRTLTITEKGRSYLT